MPTVQERIINELKNYFTTDTWAKAKKKNPTFAQALEKIEAKNISFGIQPKFIIGYVYGNATGYGESHYGDTTTERRVSIDFKTKEYLFTSIYNTASKKTCQEAVKRFDYNTDAYYDQSEQYKIAKDRGEFVCYEDLSDLGFMMKNCYLNRYGIEFTSDSFNCPLWPIEVTLTYPNGSTKKMEIGYWEEHNGKGKADLDIKVPFTAIQKLIIAGVAVGVVGIIGLIVSFL